MTDEEFIAKYWPYILVVAAWALYWKGRALWAASQDKSIKWFVALLIVNTLGILEILYLFVFRKGKAHEISEAQ